MMDKLCVVDFRSEGGDLVPGLTDGVLRMSDPPAVLVKLHGYHPVGMTRVFEPEVVVRVSAVYLQPVPGVTGEPVTVDKPKLAGGALAFTPEELEVQEHVIAAMRGIFALGLREDTKNLETELSTHVHGLQMFVVKHAMERLGFEGVSRWFTR